MIIDFHTHIFPDSIAEKSVKFLAEKGNIKNHTEGTARSLLESQEKAGIDLSVVLPVATKPKQFSSITKFAAFVNEKYEGNLLSFGGIHPLSPDFKQELKTIKSEGLKGIKLHPEYQDVFINDIACKRLIYEASALGLITVIHAGRDVAFPEPVRSNPDGIAEVIAEIKPEKFVLAHFGGFHCWDEVEEKICGKDVYIDTSSTLEYIDEELFKKIYRKHGYKKILFATDSPWCDQKNYVETIKKLIKNKKELKLVMGGNAQKLLALI